MGRRAKRPGRMDKVQSRIWERYTSDPKRYSLKHMAEAMGRNVTYIQQFLQYGTPTELPERPRRKLAQFLGVPESELVPSDYVGEVLVRRQDDTKRGDPMSEGEPVSPEESPDYLRAAIENQKMELWRLLINKIGTDFKEGQLLVVDPDLSKRRPGCMVLATVRETEHTRVIFRLSLPPRLFTVGSTTLELPEIEDNERVVVRGVVRGRDEPVW